MLMYISVWFQRLEAAPCYGGIMLFEHNIGSKDERSNFFKWKDFLLIGWVSEEGQENSIGLESSTRSQRAGHGQDFYKRTPHVWDECSWETRNTKDKQIWNNTG